MLTGENPFYTHGDMDQMQLFKAIVKGKYTYPHNGRHVTDAAKDLIDHILVADPKERLGCKARADLDIREHAWFDGFDWGALYRKELTPPWTPKVKNPFDGSRFANWSEAEQVTHPSLLKPLSDREQQLFADFGH